MARKKKNKCNNSYKLPNHVAEEILSLNNRELISRASSEYANWIASENLKKTDPKLKAVRSQIKELMNEVNESDEVIELESKLKELKETLYSEKLETYREENKNLLAPYKEDISFFKACFKLTMDEVNRRRQEGLLTVEGKIV